MKVHYYPIIFIHLIQSSLCNSWSQINYKFNHPIYTIGCCIFTSTRSTWCISKNTQVLLMILIGVDGFNSQWSFRFTLTKCNTFKVELSFSNLTKWKLPLCSSQSYNQPLHIWRGTLKHSHICYTEFMILDPSSLAIGAVSNPWWGSQTFIVGSQVFGVVLKSSLLIPKPLVMFPSLWCCFQAFIGSPQGELCLHPLALGCVCPPACCSLMVRAFSCSNCLRFVALYPHLKHLCVGVRQLQL